MSRIGFQNPLNKARHQPVGQHGRVLLYTLSFMGMGVSMACVSWASGDVVFSAALAAVAGLGHFLSSLGERRKLRLGFVIYPAALLAIWMMQEDMLAIVAGGSLFPLARFLMVVQTLVSFNLRSLRTLFDTLLLNLAVILLASQEAISAHFALFLLVFIVITVAFMVTTHMASTARQLQWATAPGTLWLAVPTMGVLLLVLGSSLAIFLLLPQGSRIRDAAPLPSRLDLTVDRPVSPRETGRGDPAPWTKFLPSRGDEDAPSGEQQDHAAIGQAEAAQSGGRLDATLDSGPIPSPKIAVRIPTYATLGYADDNGGEVVMYVRSPLASFWRGQVLDEYDGRGWTVSNREPQMVLGQRGRLRFPDTLPWTGLLGTYVQTYFLQVQQPDAIFTGYSPGVIASDISWEARDLRTGATESVKRLRQISTYRVVSAVPQLTPDLLRNDSADQSYLQDVQPMSVPGRVQELAHSIVAGARSDYEKAARLEQFLLDNYKYDLRVPPLPRSSDVVKSFLFDRQAGYCAQFATSMAVMARSIGLPARVATGYLPGRYDTLTGVHVVRLQDAHAWVEIKFQKYGWVPFDPTPRPDSPWTLDTGYAQATQSIQRMLRAQLKDLVIRGPSSAISDVATLFSSGGVARVGGTVSVLSLPLLVLVLVVMGQKRRKRPMDLPASYTPLPGGARSEVKDVYQRALRLLQQKGYPRRQAHQSPREYVEALYELRVPVSEAFQEISHQAGDALYNPQPLRHSVVQKVKQKFKELRKVPRRVQGNP